MTEEEALAEPLARLHAQKPGRGPLTDEQAAWAWAVANVPGGTVTWRGPSVSVSLPGRELALTITQDPAAWRVGRGTHLRTSHLASTKDGIRALVLPESLEPVLAACETNCVAGCCGLEAFVVSPSALEDATREAQDDLDAIIDEVACEGASILSSRFNAVWSNGRECAAYLETWRAALPHVR